MEKIKRITLEIKKIDFKLSNRIDACCTNSKLFKGNTENSIGSQINDLFCNFGKHIPEKITQLTFETDIKFFNKSKLGISLIKALGETGGNLISWETNIVKSKSTEFIAEFQNANPYALIGAFSAAIKNNSAALGKDAVLFDVKAIEQVPKIAKYICRYMQRSI